MWAGFGGVRVSEAEAGWLGCWNPIEVRCLPLELLEHGGWSRVGGLERPLAVLLIVSWCLPLGPADGPLSPGTGTESHLDSLVQVYLNGAGHTADAIFKAGSPSLSGGLALEAPTAPSLLPGGPAP